MIKLYVKFHVPRSTSSLVISNEQKAKENIRTAAMFFFYSSQELTEQQFRIYRRYILLRYIIL